MKRVSTPQNDVFQLEPGFVAIAIPDTQPRVNRRTVDSPNRLDNPEVGAAEDRGLPVAPRWSRPAERERRIGR